MKKRLYLVLLSVVAGSAECGSAVQAEPALSGIGEKLFIQIGVGAVPRAHTDKSRDTVSVFDFMTPAQIADVRSQSGLIDVAGAINAAIAAQPGRIRFPAGVYAVGSPILLKTNRVLVGDGPGSPNPVSGVQRVTVIRPKEGFTGARVLLADPANDGTDVYSYGVGLSNLTIDMYNIRAEGKTAIELNSATNCETFANLRVLNQDSGNFVKMGVSANKGALQTDGIVFDNFYAVSNAIDSNNTAPGVVIYRSNEISFRDSKITRRSNGVPPAKTVGIHIYSDAAGVANDVRLNNVVVAGYETGVLTESKNGAPQGPRWIRSFGAGFESVKYGFRFVGNANAPTQFHTIISTRQQSTVSGGVLVVMGDYAANSNIAVEEFAGVPINGGAAQLVTLAANSQGNIVNAQPSGVTDRGINNVIIGRTGGALQISKIYREPTKSPVLLNSWASGTRNRASAGYWKDAQGVVHLQGYLSGGSFGSGTGNIIMRLPEGYRPGNGTEFPAATEAGFAGLILIAVDGSVYPLAGSRHIALDGITFPTY